MLKYVITILLVAGVCGSADTLTLQPGPEGKDTYIDEWYQGMNYGGASWAYIRGPDPCQFTLIEWDLSTIPEGAEVITAMMELYCYMSGGGYYPPEAMAFYRIMEYWDEDTVNWLSQPEITGFGVVYAEWPATDEWVSFDLTENVTLWQNGTIPNYGILGNGYDYHGVYTACLWTSDYMDDAQLRPKLTIEYTPADDPDEAVVPVSLGAIKAGFAQ